MIATMFSFFNVSVSPDQETQAGIEKSKKAADKACPRCGRVGMDYDGQGQAVCPRCKHVEVVK